MYVHYSQKARAVAEQEERGKFSGHHRTSVIRGSKLLENIMEATQVEWSTDNQPFTDPQTTGRYPSSMGRVTKVTLKGPSHPHEVSFLPLTTVGRRK